MSRESYKRLHYAGAAFHVPVKEKVMTLEEAGSRMGTILQEETKTDLKYFPVGLLSIIVELALSLLSSCLSKKTPEQVSEFVKKQPFLTELTIRAAMRKAGLSSSPYASGIRNTIYRAAVETAPDEMWALTRQYKDLID